MSDPTYQAAVQLAAGLPSILESPKDGGTVRLIVSRPKRGQRRLLSEAEVSSDEGVHGDHWAATTSHRLDDGRPDRRSQIALINSRCLELLAGGDERMSLAGDNLVVDLDLSFDNLPVGQRLQLGEAEIEITDRAHLGCRKFRDRYGPDALAFVNSDRGKFLRLRGVYARVVHGGLIHRGDTIRKVPRPPP
jgi:MOSC domain-containing protein YiiM